MRGESHSGRWIVRITNTMSKYEISRSFSRKVQVKQYEPVEFFCAAKAEVETIEDIKATSQLLSAFVKDEVEKSIAQLRIEDSGKNKKELIEKKKNEFINQLN